MAQITGGEISFGDGLKSPIEYQPAKTAKATFSFSVGEGENPDAIIDDATARARAKVAELLGSTVTPKTPAKKPPAPAAAERTHATKEQVAEIAKIAAEPLAISTGGERLDPAAMDVGEDDPLLSLPKEVTDVELTAAIGKHNQATKNAVAIRKLIGVYTPQDGKVYSAAGIPQEKRQAFLSELAKVPKAA